MDSYFSNLQKDSLLWLPEHGIGYYPVKESPYDSAYFDKYVKYANTSMGIKLTEARVKFVDKYWKSNIVDIGIGCGDFIEKRKNSKTFGFDINPKGVKWLCGRNIFFDPSKQKIEGATFWDSLEHIHDPNPILRNVTNWIFVSIPIYRDAEHILKSKHFRKDEHCWYFTNKGFLSWMASKGFECVEISQFESILGRQDIWSYVFKRV